MTTKGPFGGKTGLQIRIGGLILFSVLLVVYLVQGDRPHVLYMGGYFFVGLLETIRYRQRM